MRDYEDLALSNSQEAAYEDMLQELHAELLIRSDFPDYQEFMQDVVADDAHIVAVFLSFMTEPRDGDFEQCRDSAAGSMIRGWVKRKTTEYIDYMERECKLEWLCGELGVTFWSLR